MDRAVGTDRIGDGRARGLKSPCDEKRPDHVTRPSNTWHILHILPVKQPGAAAAVPRPAPGPAFRGRWACLCFAVPYTLRYKVGDSEYARSRQGPGRYHPDPQ